MDITQSLKRTFDPKYTHYSCDGGGRDTYINSNNGGLMKLRLKDQPLKETNKGKLSFFAPAPRSESWGLTYYSDGSGRDFYITHNSGGLYSKFSPLGDIKRFKQSLRQPIVRETNDMFTKTQQRWVDYKGRQVLMKNKNIVDGVVKRLTSPSLSPEAKGKKFNLRSTF
jgi:hypothetical protein